MGKNTQIEYYGLINRDELHSKLIHYDFTLIPLTNRIYGSVPSKIFEYSRLGLPIIYLSEGEGSNLVNKYRLGYTIRDNDFKRLNSLISDLANQKKTLFKNSEIQQTSKGVFDFNNQFKKLLENTNSL